MHCVMHLDLTNDSCLLLLNRVLCGIARYTQESASKVMAHLDSMRRVRQHSLDMIAPTQVVRTAARPKTVRSTIGGLGPPIDMKEEMATRHRRVVAAMMNGYKRVCRHAVRESHSPPVAWCDRMCAGAGLARDEGGDALRRRTGGDQSADA